MTNINSRYGQFDDHELGQLETKHLGQFDVNPEGKVKASGVANVGARFCYVNHWEAA